MKKIELKELIGLSLEDSIIKIKEHGLVSRVVENNGKTCMVTSDFRTDRISLYVKNDIVIKANFIG